MLKMSSRSTYALKALIYLVRHASNRTESLHTVAEAQNIPLPYLEQIFSKLKKSGLVEAIRGPHGGFKLARAADQISLAQIIMAMEGDFEPVLCSYPENRTADCHEVGDCTSRTLCNELDGALLHVLSSKTLGLMCQEAENIHHQERRTA